MASDERARLGLPVVGPPVAGVDEDLLVSGSGRGRLSWLLLVLATAVLLAWALVSASANRHRATTPPQTVARTRPNGAPAPPVLIVPQPDPRWCPDAGDGQTACSSSEQVPAPVLAAVRSRVLRLDHLSTFEERSRDVGFGPGGLWYREVRGRHGLQTITIEVYQRNGPVHAGTVQDGSTLTVTHLFGVLIVRVRATGRIASPDSLVALADDPRLRTRAAAGSASGS